MLIKNGAGVLRFIKKNWTQSVTVTACPANTFGPAKMLAARRISPGYTFEKFEVE